MSANHPRPAMESRIHRQGRQRDTESLPLVGLALRANLAAIQVGARLCAVRMSRGRVGTAYRPSRHPARGATASRPLVLRYGWHCVPNQLPRVETAPRAVLIASREQGQSSALHSAIGVRGKATPLPFPSFAPAAGRFAPLHFCTFLAPPPPPKPEAAVRKRL